MSTDESFFLTRGPFCEQINSIGSVCKLDIVQVVLPVCYVR